MENDKTIEQLEKIIEDLKKAKRNDAEDYVVENFKMLLDDVDVMVNINWMGDVLSMYLPYDCKLVKKVKEACGKYEHDGIDFEYDAYDILINKENQAWRLQVGPLPEKYSNRVEFIKKHISNIDISGVFRDILSIKNDIGYAQEKMEKYEAALKDIGK